jgi:fido (protein-threonine AMPylation protein)
LHVPFEASPEFDYDVLRTAVEIERCGHEVSAWLEAVATGDRRNPSIFLVREIHRRWFETTFPAAAGKDRQGMVTNRNAAPVPVDAIVPAVAGACGNWVYRREHFAPCDGPEFIEFVVAEANTLAVAIYDAHPFVDGNTRTTWHLRNYVLMLDGLLPLGDLADEAGYAAAWKSAQLHDHVELDRVVLAELLAHDR